MTCSWCHAGAFDTRTHGARIHNHYDCAGDGGSHYHDYHHGGPDSDASNYHHNYYDDGRTDGGASHYHHNYHRTNGGASHYHHNNNYHGGTDATGGVCDGGRHVLDHDSHSMDGRRRQVGFFFFFFSSKKKKKKH